MRSSLVVALFLFSGCNGSSTEVLPTEPVTPVQTPTPPTEPVEAEFGYDTRPSNPSCIAPTERFTESASIETTRVFNSVNLNDPLAMLQAPGDPDTWYVIEQAGRVKRFDGSVASPTAEVVLNHTAEVQGGGEMGLLGFAFHPDFATNGKVVLSFTDNASRSILATVDTSNNGAVWDANTITEIFSVAQPYSNHNGGDVAFGPDGMLYWGLGDGGSAGDPENRAQNLNSYLGKILRFDIDNGTPYAVPADNPFVGVAGAREEIYAYGLRNPFRFSFDSGSGELWTGDVGQNAVEEIDKIESGGNYGWRLKEGNNCYATTPCDGDGLIDPEVAYNQDPGFSVIGGVVYRGSAIPELVGTYLFSDYYHGRIVAVTYRADGTARRQRLADTFGAIVHFASGNDGEVYFLDRDAGSMNRIDPATGGETSDFPMTLSATGCVSAIPTVPAPGVIPYGMSHGFWSDHAEKRRWMAIPDGTQINVAADGDFEFPVGTVLMKEFNVNNVRVETRLFMRHSDTVWAGYSYKWREDGQDADLLRSNEVVDADGVEWEIPSPANCMQCHTVAAGRSLGLELGQLANSIDYPATGRRSPQLDTLAHIGLLAATPPETVAWPAVDDETATVEERARTYLHVNCSQCHRPEGPGRGDMDFRKTTALANMGVCAAPIHGDLGIANARVVDPGSPETSVLLARLRDEGAYRMPPMGSAVVDDVGSALIEQWITGLTCP